MPLHQDTLIHLLAIGMSKSHPLNGRDTIDMAESMVKRAASLHHLVSEDFPILSSDKVQEVMECLFQLTAYTYPETITLPPEYTPPSMAIATAYWKAWSILVILCAHNPGSFGKVAWQYYPTLRALMEMCIINQYVFPSPGMAPPGSDRAEEMKAKDVQVCAMERQSILDFETQLAAATSKATINESNSHLLAVLITMDPKGALRKPPQQFLLEFQQSNQHYRLGHLLCRSRQPDFLQDIMKRQGTNQAMPWLSDLVDSAADGSFSVLPVQCLCEVLLNSSEETGGQDSNSDVRKRKQKQLLRHLQGLLQSGNNERESVETLEYFLRRLGSQQTHQRLRALKGLRMVLSENQPGVDNDDSNDGVEMVAMDVDGRTEKQTWTRMAPIQFKPATQ